MPLRLFVGVPGRSKFGVLGCPFYILVIRQMFHGMVEKIFQVLLEHHMMNEYLYNLRLHSPAEHRPMCGGSSAVIHLLLR